MKLKCDIMLSTFAFNCNLRRHDAVSGTAKQHVTDDYAKRISAGLAAVAPEVENMLAAALSPGGQELTLVHFSAQPEPFLTLQPSPKRPTTSSTPAINTP